MHVASPFFNMGAIDAHFRDAGKDADMRDGIKTTCKRETTNLR